MKRKLIGEILAVLALAVIFCVAGFESKDVQAAWEGDFYIENGLLSDYKGSGGAVTIPNTVTAIGNRAFYDRDSITSVTIPSTVKSIGEYAFCYCDSLASVVFQVDSNGASELSLIDNRAFASCTSLAKILIPEGVATIGQSAFGACNYLSKAYIPASVSAIKRDAFYNTALSTVYYGGTEYQWNSIAKGNYALSNYYDGGFYGALYYNAKRTDFDSSAGATYSYDERPGGLFWDYEGTDPVDEIVLWVNAKKVKEDGQEVNKSEAVLYTDILASYILTSGQGKNSNVATGKVIAGITDSDATPGQSVLQQKNGAVSISVKSGKITIKAKSSPGEYYLHVLDTGDKKKHACCKLTIKASPSKIELVDKDGKEFKDKTLTMLVGRRCYIGVQPKCDGTKGEIIATAEHVDYKVTGKATSCYEGDWDCYLFVNSSQCFHSYDEMHKVGSYYITATGLKGTNTVANIQFTDSYSMKNAKLKLKTINPVYDIWLRTTEDATVGLKDDSEEKYNIASPTFTIQIPDESKKGKNTSTGKINVYTDFMGDNYVPGKGFGYDNVYWAEWQHDYPTTDKPKLMAISDPNGLDLDSILYNNKLKITGKPTSEQKKVKAKLSKDNRYITITVKKGAVPGTKAWFVLFFNNGIENYNTEYSNVSPNMDHVGFMVFCVEVTENQPKSVSISGEGIDKKKQLNIAYGSSKQLTATVEMAKEGKEFDGEMVWTVGDFTVDGVKIDRTYLGTMPTEPKQATSNDPAEQEALTAEYEQKHAAYETALGEYNARLAIYNTFYGTGGSSGAISVNNGLVTIGNNAMFSTSNVTASVTATVKIEGFEVSDKVTITVVKPTTSPTDQSSGEGSGSGSETGGESGNGESGNDSGSGESGNGEPGGQP